MRTEIGETESCIDKRTLRAATESMTVVVHEKERFDVYSGETGRYDVNLVAGTCDCPAAKYQEGKCKHICRVEMEVGQREIPDLDRRTDIEIMADASDETHPAIATDGGVVVDGTPQGSDAEGGCPHDYPDCEGTRRHQAPYPVLRLLGGVGRVRRRAVDRGR